MSKAEAAYELFKSAVGEAEGTGDWFEVDQDRINAFADVTIDHQFIHVDPEQCAQLSPWKVPIAHGFLTLSLLTHLSGSIKTPPERFDGILMANSLHFVKDKPRALSSVLRLLNPTGRLLLVEYDTDRGNPWVPYPLSYESWRKLAPAIGLTEPRRLATYPSQWANQMYSAGSELLRPERTASA